MSGNSVTITLSDNTTITFAGITSLSASDFVATGGGGDNDDDDGHDHDHGCGDDHGHGHGQMGHGDHDDGDMRHIRDLPGGHSDH